MLNRVIILTISLFVSAQNVMGMEPDSNHNFSEKGKGIFQQRKQGIVDRLSQEFLKHRASNEELSREELRNILKNTAEKRAYIAYDSGDQSPVDFFTFRMDSDSEFTTTDLTNHSYDLMRTHIQSRIREMIANSENGNWIEDGQTRFRLRLQTLDEFPITINHKVMTDFVEKNEEQNATVLPHEREDFDTALHFNYAQQFIFGGCCAFISEGATSYQKPILDYFQDRLAKIMSNYRNEKRPLDICSYLNQQDEWDFCLPGVPMIRAPIFDVQASRFVWIDIEHKMDGQNFIPGYGIVGLLPDTLYDLEGDFPLMLTHPARLYLPLFVNKYEELLHQAIRQTPTDLITLVGQFQYHWSKAMPIERGSAAVGEFITEGLYQSYGYTNVQFDRALFASPDNGTFMFWTEEKFLETYRKAIKMDKLL